MRAQGVLAALSVAGCGGVEEPRRGPSAAAVEGAHVTPTPAAVELRMPVAALPTTTATHEEPAAAPPTPASDPRAVPPGTAPQASRAFQRIPVAIQDGPPVGGIGATGIHVDKIWLGDRYEREGCVGESARFSLARHSQVGVCFRVVHSRVEESVDVLWEKDGAPFRSRGVTIPDLHAYRTRAYLALRREYVGQWKARVMSTDGVELASASFTVEE